MVAYVIVAIIAYALGSISFSVIFSRKFAGFDVREKGSKNAGTTNVLRTVGKKAAAITLVCDILKGVVSVLIAIIVGSIWKDLDMGLLKYLAGFMAIIGHTFPIFFGFKGGKGVATALGVLLTIDPIIGLICLVFAIILIAITRMVSVGSILAAILFPVLNLFIGKNNTVITIVMSILIGLLIIFNHRKNIQRIREGNENKLSFKK